MKFILLPFFIWLIVGIIKFLFNCAIKKRLALDSVGYGGFPSNHSAICSGTTFLVGLNEGFESPLFCVSLTFSFLVILDASGLRNIIGSHSIRLNELYKSQAPHGVENALVRESVGHRKCEIIVGILVGVACAYLINGSL